MPNVKMNGIIIAENNMGDFDKMLTMLTPNVGKISCVAKGARRPKSSLLAGTQLFSFGEYLMFKGTNTYHINSCEIIEIFYELRNDLEKLTYAMHINKIILDVTTENQNSFNILQLYLNTLYTISKTKKGLELVLAIFKIRLLTYLGFKPKIDKCVQCNQKENIVYFSIRDDGIKCIACAKTDKSAIKMNRDTLNAIKFITMAPPKKLYSFNLKGESLEELKLISRIYFNDKLEQEYKI